MLSPLEDEDPSGLADSDKLNYVRPIGKRLFPASSTNLLIVWRSFTFFLLSLEPPRGTLQPVRHKRSNIEWSRALQSPNDARYKVYILIHYRQEFLPFGQADDGTKWCLRLNLLSRLNHLVVFVTGIGWLSGEYLDYESQLIQWWWGKHDYNSDNDGDDG